MSETEAEFWASVVGALVGGLIAAGTAFALFIAERRSARASREEERARERERADAEQRARKIEDRESLLDAVEGVLLEVWVDDADPQRAMSALRELKMLTRRASSSLKASAPGASTWLSKLHFAAAVRVAAYLLVKLKPETDRTPDDQMAGPVYNGWMNTQLDTLVGWRLGEVSDEEMLAASSRLLPAQSESASP